MAEGIDPLHLKLAQLIGEDEAFGTAAAIQSPTINQEARVEFGQNLFEDMLSKATESLEGVSRAEAQANEMMQKYASGQVGIQEAMLATSKMSIMVQFAVTVINTAVSTFKEITQMQV